MTNSAPTTIMHVVADQLDYIAAVMAGAEDLFVTLDELLHRPAWHADALCREHPETEFVPPDGVDGRAMQRESQAARIVCRRCAVRVDCAAFALADPTLVGIWGGTSYRARKRARVRGLSAAEMLAEIDRPQQRPNRPAAPAAAMCAGCGGDRSRKDLERDDRWCWACRASATDVA